MNTMNVGDVATEFVRLVMKYSHFNCDWEDNKSLPENEREILFNIVKAAGFKSNKVVPGKLERRYQNDDGSTPGVICLINSVCPFKVVGESGDHEFATGWLDCAVSRVVNGSVKLKEDEKKLIAVIIKEIKRSVPLEPICLTIELDYLCEQPPNPKKWSYGFFVDHTKDNDTLRLCVGIHKRCNGLMDRKQSSDMCDVLLCRECCLRVPFPSNVKTYDELRKVFSY